MINSKAFRVCAIAIAGMAASGGAAQASCGTASWYHEGSQTANGERYRPDGITAAHRTLPFGTKVLVKNQRTGRTVTVRINDRGPFIRGRIIDLSRGAKKVIGMDGLAPVCISVIGRGERYADAGAKKQRRVARNNRKTRTVYNTTQTSASMERPSKRKRSAQRSRVRSESQVAQRRQYRERREDGQYRESTGRQGNSSSSFKLAGWPRETSF
jgi:rare lipoprotein A